MHRRQNASRRASSDASAEGLSWGTELIVVAAGGALGASLRALTYHFLTWPLAWPLDRWLAGSAIQSTALETLTLNLMGALGLGMLFAALQRSRPSPLLRPFLAVGVLGSYTTYSTLIVESRLIADERGVMTGMALILSSLLLGILAFVVGERLVGAARETHAERGSDGA